MDNIVYTGGQFYSHLLFVWYLGNGPIESGSKYFIWKLSFERIFVILSFVVFLFCIFVMCCVEIIIVECHQESWYFARNVPCPSIFVYSGILEGRCHCSLGLEGPQ